MANGYLELSDGRLLGWSSVFAKAITADPQRYGLSSDDAEHYADLDADYSQALSANDPGVRSKVTTLGKNGARAALLADARLLISKINGHKGLTDAEKVAIGVPVRAARASAGVLESAPSLAVMGVQGRTVSIVLTHGVNQRGKPSSAIGATLFCYVGEVPSENWKDWTFIGNFGRTSIDVVFPGGLPIGTKVWLSAQWMNSRLEPSAMAAPVSTHLQTGVVTLPTSGPRAGWAHARAA